MVLSRVRLIRVKLVLVNLIPINDTYIDSDVVKVEGEDPATPRLLSEVC